MLHGKRLNGAYVLVKFKRAGKNDWLLFRAAESSAGGRAEKNPDWTSGQRSHPPEEGQTVSLTGFRSTLLRERAGSAPDRPAGSSRHCPSSALLLTRGTGSGF